MTGQHTDVRRTRAWRRLVVWAKQNLPWTCHLCGGRIPQHVTRFHPLSYALDHVATVRDHPELALSHDNVKPSHKQCNDWRKARPLTLGLLIECRETFAVRPPAALDFFNQSPTATGDPAGRVGQISTVAGGPATVIPSAVSPRSLSVTEPVGSQDGPKAPEPVTQPGHG